MKVGDYFHVLTEEDKIRIVFRENRGKVEHFVVQYLSLINGRWRSIMRLDTCHGYAHKHTFHLHSKEHIINLTKRGEVLNQVFKQSTDYTIDNFLKIKHNFLQT